MNDNIIKTWFCIFNPIAGKHDPEELWKSINEKLDKYQLVHNVHFTKAKKDAENITIELINSGHRNFIAIGGDGTIHEVINGFMKQNIVRHEELTLGIIPVGTGNDWAKHHGINNNLDKICQKIKSGVVSFQDIGVASFISNNNPKTEYFNNVAGMAYDAYIVDKLEQRVKKPNKLIYIFSILKHLFKYKLQEATIRVNGEVSEGKFYTINVGICKYSGGGMSIVPHAMHDDGLLAVTIAGNLSKMEVIMNTYRFYNMTITQHKKIKSYQVKSIEINNTSTSEILLELDGESVGKCPARFEIIEKALRFIK